MLWGKWWVRELGASAEKMSALFELQQLDPLLLLSVDALFELQQLHLLLLGVHALFELQQHEEEQLIRVLSHG